MPSNKIQITAEFMATLSNMDKIVQEANSKLGQIGVGGAKGKTFSGLFDKFEQEYAKIQSLTKNGSLDLLDSKAFAKSGKNIIDIAKEITTALEGMDPSKLGLGQLKNLFPDSFKTNTKEAISLINSFISNSAKLTKVKAAYDDANKAIQEQQDILKAIKATGIKNEETPEITKATEAWNAQTDAVNKLKAARTALNREAGKYKGQETRANNKKNSLQKELDDLQKIATPDANQQARIAQLSAQIEELKNVALSAHNAMQKTLETGNGAGSQDQLTQQIAEAEAKAQEYEKILAELRQEQGGFATPEIKAQAITEATKKLKELQDQANSAKFTMDNLLSLTNNQTFANKLQSFGIDPAKIDLSTEGLIRLREELDNLDPQTATRLKQELETILTTAGKLENTRGALQPMVNETNEAATSAQRAANEYDSLLNRLKSFFSIGTAAHTFRRMISSAVSTVKELDATMTEAAVVTDFSVSDMWDQLPKYTSEATKLGATTNDLYSATTLYYQQGLNSNEAMSLGIETMKMARIASLDAAEATDLMTAALRGFNMELNETSAQKVNDVYSKLAAVTAADTGEIGIAVSKTASIAASAGMDLETTAALLSQIIETTREAPETAGTAMKTIIARFTEVKKLFTEDQLTGTDEEGEEIDINKIDAALKTVGISLKGFLRGETDIGSILIELASKWDSIDVATQRYIATTAAGSRQQSRFLAMMSNYSRTMELVDTAYNSTGASQEQFEKTLDSLSAKTAQLRNAWNQFLMGISESDTIKGAIDALTGLLNIINGLLDATSGKNSFAKGLQSILLLIGAFKGGKLLLDGKHGGGLLSAIGLKPNGRLSSQVKQGAAKAGDGVGTAFMGGFGLNIKKAFTKGSGFWSDTTNSLINKQEAFGSQLLNEYFSKDNIGFDDSEDVRANLAQMMRDAAGGDEGAAQGLANAGVMSAEQLEEYTNSARNAEQATAEMQGRINALGGAMTAFGTIISAISGQFSGPVAEGFQAAGIALIAFGAILPVISAGLAELNISAGVIGVIGLAIAGIIGLVTAGVKAAEANSIEGRLKAAKEAADEAKQAADEAKQAYDNLLGAHGNYDALVEKLGEVTEGTLEWKQIIEEINALVMQLADEYGIIPTFENGHLTISSEQFAEMESQKKQEATNKTNDAIDATVNQIAIQGEDYRNDYSEQLGISENSIYQQMVDEYIRTGKINDYLLTDLAYDMHSPNGYDAHDYFTDDQILGFTNTDAIINAVRTAASAPVDAATAVKPQYVSLLANNIDRDFFGAETDAAATKIYDQFMNGMAESMANDTSWMQMESNERVSKLQSAASDYKNLGTKSQQILASILNGKNYTSGEIDNIPQEVNDFLETYFSGLNVDTITESLNDQYTEIQAGLIRRGVTFDLPNMTVDQQEALLTQIRESGFNDNSAEQLAKAYNGELGLTPDQQKEFSNILSTTDFTDPKDIAALGNEINKLKATMSDTTLIDQFWEAINGQGYAVFDSINSVASYGDYLAEQAKEVEEVQKRLTEGSATAEDLKLLDEAGIDYSDSLERTADGWKISEAAAEEYAKVQREILANNAAITAQETRAAIEKKTREYASYFNGDDTTGYTSNWENFKDSNDMYTFALNNDIYTKDYRNDDGTTNTDAYFAAVEAKYNEVMDFLNNAEAMRRTADENEIYQKSQLYAGEDGGQNALGDEQSTVVLDQMVTNEEAAATVDRLTDSYKELYGAESVNEDMMKALAVDSIRSAKNMDNLNKTVSENVDALKQGDKAGYAYDKAITEITKDAKKVFGDHITEDFVAEHADLFAQLNEGGDEAEEAYSKIGEAAALSMADASVSTEQLQGFIDQINGENIEIGGTANLDAIFTELAGVMGSAEAAAEFIESLGYTVTWIPNGTTPDGRFPNYKTVVTRTGAAGSGVSKGGGGGGGGGGDPWKAEYDWLYNLVQKTNEEMRKRNKLEWEYEKILNRESMDLAEGLKNRRQQVDSLKTQLALYKEQNKKRYIEADRIENEYSDVGQYAKYNEKLGYVEIDWDAIDAISGKKGNEDTGKQIDEYIKKLEDISDKIDDTEDQIMDIQDQLDDLLELGRDELIDLEEQLIDAIVELRQQEIDNLSEIYDGINENNTELLTAISDGLAEYRDAREKEEERQNISEMENRLALLQSDTSGANALEIMKLQDDLQEARQDYTDSLIDKSIDEMTRQNEQAYEQRQKQIELMQAQLEWSQENGIIAHEADLMLEEAIKTGVTDKITDLLASVDKGNGYWSTILTQEEVYNSIQQGFEYWKETMALDGSNNDFAEQMKGQSITFMGKDGQSHTGIVQADGTVKVGDQIYSDILRGLDGSWYQTIYGEITKYIEPIVEAISEPIVVTTPVVTVSSGGGGSGGKLPERGEHGESKSFLTPLPRVITPATVGEAVQHAAQELALEIQDKITSSITVAEVTLELQNKTAFSGKSGKFNEEFLGLSGKFASGGLADQTGPAWLDGTKQHPEYVLNPVQTERFFNLVDVLQSFDTSSSGKSSSGDNYYDVHIEVDELSNDYDVEQLADKIQRLIKDDAYYRNVNAVGFGRR